MKPEAKLRAVRPFFGTRNPLTIFGDQGVQHDSALDMDQSEK